ncbi:TPA: hypothetical protein LC219_002142 [Salmonella enterica subsp. enterica serovar Teltow]|uniref:Uncharacterized protein n=2 Tax=Salmonella enterica I TaxID=59201 RepID=A0A5V6PSP2_SALET|nr:hypothetical protein [Salmonella enterica]EBU8203421.1 hypothetical protein [Salmonella enterica subsp. enterica serovar Cardoner]EBW6195702.1 hypothetical protein [Salmonella enterica subsp. enterica serovar Agbeni]ECE5861374.1 hypothetical protein [Salmonella enterica subsp. enterica]HBJ6332795.1 hypothetical protein [Salmonella enterica subsp. enterica serovar Teltow]EBW7241701.1 hypothetical protein [Salmonella enterica subsp. enterica serovar Cardoner]
MTKQPAITVGTYCIHTSKWEKRRCRVVAHDGAVVVVKMERGGYIGVPEKSLTPEKQNGDAP